MCGIVGIVSTNDVVPRLLQGLRTLEYRGYDSAGVAVIRDDGLAVRRAVGRLQNLEHELSQSPLSGMTGIGHTRWATHGAPTVTNAHPHRTTNIAVVHNGIVENYRPLRRDLESQGYQFQTETDTETVLHLVDRELEAGVSPREAVRLAMGKLHGTFALTFAFAEHPDLLIAARQGAPLAIGPGINENFVASDALALTPHTNQVIYLHEGDVAEVTSHAITIIDSQGMPVDRPTRTTASDFNSVDLGGHAHYMAKEIHEQPGVLSGMLSRKLTDDHTRVLPQELPLEGIGTGVDLIACGTAHYAAMVAEHWIELLARLRTKTHIASEFRYRQPLPNASGPAIFISQSGETADTLAAAHLCQQQGRPTIAVVNVVESSLARTTDACLQIHAGPEIGVASTKAFVAQLAALACLAAELARQAGRLTTEGEEQLATALSETPRLVAEAIACESAIREIATAVAELSHVLYVGRGNMYPLALEGALKLKEISYLHAEGYAAGELKHGPIALVDADVAIVTLAPRNDQFEKTVSNMHESIARGAKAILVSDQLGIADAGADCWTTIEVPACDPLVAPIVYAPVIQLLAYHAAVARGTDVDKPRNLAKSVTVE